MEDKSNTIKRISTLINSDTDFKILKDIHNISGGFSGEVEINYLGANLSFQIIIPQQYPLTHPNSDNISITFKNEDYIGLGHINPDGSVCFHPDKDDDFDRKFLYELKCLKQWIKEYYILEKEDDNYTYLIHKTEKGKFDRLYFTNMKNEFKQGEFGQFDYSVFSNEKFGDDKIPVNKYFRLGFDNEKQDKWSESFAKDLNKNNCKKGLYYFIEKEPLRKGVKGRKSIENWNELGDYLSNDFLEFLYKGLKSNFGNNFFFDKSLFLIVGYKIPNEHSYEEHWDLIKINKGEKLIEAKKLSKAERKSQNNYFTYCLSNQEIKWGSTENIDYSRFFGRGKLHSKITDSNILIVGCGALGSSLAEILVRGGVKNLVIEDFDSIKGGNLCRANYDLNDMIYPKTIGLIKRLKSISPFLNVKQLNVKMNHFDLEKLKVFIDKNVDVIFDCSTDPEMTFILDEMDVSADVFSMAITNNAKSFINITGKDLTKKAKLFFDYIENEPPSYYEGTGCGYPTFEANYNDINTLLNTSVKVINNNYINNKATNCFIVKPNFNERYEIQIEDYEYLELSSLNSSVSVSKEVLREIKAITNSHYPNEFGGVYIGYKSELEFIITNILIPDEFKNGKTIFERHPGTLNERLSEIHKTSNGKIQYLGEWHSHPDGPTTPSDTDIIAMKEISEDEKINIDKPLLMIIEIGKIPFGKELFIFDNEKLKKYE